MRADGIGLYVHIPFCKRKCNYCDFCSFADITDEKRSEYIDRLAKEISEYKREPRITVDSVFFGGGTPSLIEPSEFERICLAIRESFDFAERCEFSVEVNPKTLTREKCEAYKRCGVNRISIGMQSIHENELKKLGRIHSFSDFLDSYKLATEYFDNVSVDLMYGIPEQTAQSFEQTLNRVASLNPAHISVYGLIVEEGTLFYKTQNTLALPSEDEECDMYALAARILGGVGYSHYEISNYAKEGFECRHNLKYWCAREYIGVGLSAASFFENQRFTNTRSLDEYLSAPDANYNREYEIPDLKTEYVMLHLRLSRGVSLSDYRERFCEEFIVGREEKIKKFESLGYLIRATDRIALTEKGFYVSNYIISELI